MSATPQLPKPRTSTPPQRNADGGSTSFVAKRCCDGCGRELGDVHVEEIDELLVTGRLPSVIDECGCQAGGGS